MGGVVGGGFIKEIKGGGGFFDFCVFCVLFIGRGIIREGPQPGRGRQRGGGPFPWERAKPRGGGGWKT